MRVKSNLSDDDETKSASYVFSIDGHRTRYHLDTLLPFYGTKFCDRFANIWGQSLIFETPQTSYNYFKATRQFFKWLAHRGLMLPDSPESASLIHFQSIDSSILNEKIWHKVIDNVSRAILNLDDNTFVNTPNPQTRNKYLESLRSGLARLAERDLLPFVLPEGRIEDRGMRTPKCLASLAHEAGRFDIEGLSAEDAYDAFFRKNNEMLEELRRLFWEELRTNFEQFQRGQELIEKCPVDIRQVADAISSTTIETIRRGGITKQLQLDAEQELAMALMLLQHRAQGGADNLPQGKLRALISPIVGHKQAQPYIEATTTSLNAAYHIIMIDAGGPNAQTLNDIPYDLYKGVARRGRRQIRSVRASKNRSGGKAVSLNLIEEDLQLSTKSTDDRPSGVKVIEIWKTISAPMRTPSGPTAERLWLWRTPGHAVVQTDLVSMSSERLPSFRRRHRDNPIIGGLAITGPAIRKAVANTRGDRGEVEVIIQKAVLSHEKMATTFEYLSEGAVRAFLNSQIRDFVNSWEAVAVTGVEDAARRLGVTESELFRREQLGLKNGLSFASLLVPLNQVGPSRKNLEIVDIAKTLSVSDQSMISLELARRALWKQFEAMVNLNPRRFMCQSACNSDPLSAPKNDPLILRRGSWPDAA